MADVVAKEEPPASEGGDEMDISAAEGSGEAAPVRPTNGQSANPLLLRAERLAVATPYDTESWVALLVEANKLNIVECRPVLERFLEIFPTASKHWRFFIEQEMQAMNYDRAEELFKRCLPQCPDVDLFSSYTRYVALSKEGQPDKHQALEAAFEFSLKHVGLDINAGPLWSAYIEFLQSVEATNAYEQSEKVKRIRKLYQRAVTLPLANVETLWREYDRFEHQLSKDLAKALLSEIHPRHVTAKQVYRDKRKARTPIAQYMLPRPPPVDPQERVREYQQVLHWQNYLAYEKMNHLRLPENQQRDMVRLAYRQALLNLRHYPEIWHSYAQWTVEAVSTDEGTKIYQRATQAIPRNLMMWFMYAEFLEERKAIKEARAVYEQLVKSEVELYDQRKEAKRRAAQVLRENAAQLPQRRRERPSDEKQTESDGREAFEREENEEEDAPTDMVASLEDDMEEEFEEIEDDDEQVSGDMMSSSNGAEARSLEQWRERRYEGKVRPLVFVQFMRFARRSEGMLQARKVVVEATKTYACHSWQLYVAAALMEAHVNKSPRTAKVLFSVGFNRFSRVVPFVQHYVNFLDSINDHTNLRVVLEKALSEIPPEQCRELWAFYARLDRDISSDLEAIKRAEARRNEASASERRPPMLDLIERYEFCGLIPCSLAYKIAIEQTSDKLHGFGAAAGAFLASDAALDKTQFPRPDLSQMIVFRDGMEPPHIRFGPLPDVLARLLLTLPPRFQGPPLNADLMIELLAGTEIPDEETLRKRFQRAKDPGSSMDAPPRARRAEDVGDVFKVRRQAKSARTSQS